MYFNRKSDDKLDISCFEKAVHSHFMSFYLQPNFDGNKRTGRILQNTILRSIGCPPPIVHSPENNEYTRYVNAFAFLTSGVVTGVYSFFKYGEKMSNHFNYSGKYADIASDIDIEMIKDRKFRTQLDVFFTKIHLRMDNLASSEPVLPKSITNKQYIKIRTEEA